MENNFDLIHCDLWISPIVSVPVHKYYVAIIDDCSHFVALYGDIPSYDHLHMLSCT
jgi:hypothetical protein